VIEFLTVRFKNFGSFGNNFSEINLNSHKTTLVTGTNGHGKSFALLDSLCFALFGKPFRPINIPQLVNTVNGKGCLVELEFNKAGSHYLIRRGLSPKIFEIHKNGEMLDQNAKSKDYQEMFEEQILGFDYSAFKQVVILGKSNFIPFMQLTPMERRKIIEGLLNLDILADMNQYVKGQLGSLKVSIAEHQSLLKIAHEKIKSQKEFLEQVKNSNDDDIKVIVDRIAEYNKQIDEDKEEQASHLENHKNLSDEIKKNNKKIESLKDVPAMLIKTETLKGTLLEEIKALEENATCKCCLQVLPPDQKQKHLQEKHRKAEECFEALKVARKKEVELEEFKKTEIKLDASLKIIIDDMQGLNYRIGNAESNIKVLEKDKKEKEAANNLTSLLNSLETSEQKKNEIAKQLEKFISDQIHYDVVYDILKDGGLKSRIIKHYVPIINGLVNKFLGKLNLYVDFTIDEEFKETIKSRYRDAFTYSSFSEGEKQRIDLAILLTWREVAKMKNSLNCNLLIFDEILDSSLDAAGTEAFMKILNKMKNKCSIYIISHKADSLIDKFDQTLQFEKKNNFSKIKQNI
jgi:DNA repair exonuclease SbcCD ATPase subunit